jgi:hypothetical protein
LLQNHRKPTCPGDKKIVKPLLSKHFKGCGGPEEKFDRSGKLETHGGFAFAAIQGDQTEVGLVCNQYDYGDRPDNPCRNQCKRTKLNSLGTSEGSVTILLDFPRQPHGVRELAERERQQQGQPKRQKKN